MASVRETQYGDVALTLNAIGREGAPCTGHYICILYYGYMPETPQCPQRLSAADAENMVLHLHSRPMDFEEGDLLHRAQKFSVYRLKSLRLADLPLGEFNIDEELVAEYAGLPTPIPPIIYDEVDGSFIDGAHRANAAVMRGDVSIMAYVGESSAMDPAWQDYTEED